MKPCAPRPTGRGNPWTHRWSRVRRSRAGCALTQGLHPAVEAAGSDPDVAQQLEDLWDDHGSSAYALACTLLGDEQAAARTVTWAMGDLAGSGAPLVDARRDLARLVYLRSEELVAGTPRTQQLPSLMVRLHELAQLQRACLALCTFGGHTYGEAADLLGVRPEEAADLLRAGLREMAGAVGGDTAATA